MSELITEEVVLLLVNQFDGLARMVLFLNADLSIHLESWRFCDDVIPIVESIMTNVVAKSSSENGQNIEFVKLSFSSNSLHLQHEVAMLGDVRCVEIIMILN